jgi:hypothetical protein
VKRRVRRFADATPAREFAASVDAPGRRAPWSAGSLGDGVYRYETGEQ